MSQNLSVIPHVFLRGFEQLFHLPAETLTGSEPLKNLQAWDSLAIVEFMAYADATYGIALAPERFRGCESIQDLFSLVSQDENH
jgi:acyl carrier protein